VVSQGGGVTRAMQDTNNHKLAVVMDIVDGVIAGKRNAQTGRKMAACGRGKRKVQKRFAIRFDPGYQPRRRRLGSFDGDVEPNLGKVGFRRVGQAEGERSATSLLPRATIVAASKSFTRPAARSANPLLMSALSAASSSI